MAWGVVVTRPSDLHPTRQSCAQCHKRMSIDFHADDETWERVAGIWANSILCLDCYAEMGDERGIAWEFGLEFMSVVSLATHLEGS